MINKIKGIIIPAISIVVVGFMLIFSIKIISSHLQDAKPATTIETQIEDISGIENPSYDDIVVLAKQGGMFERLVVFYNDSTIMGDKDPTPYSLVVEYDNDDTETSISIRNKASFKLLYDALFNILVIQRKIGK